MAPELIRRTRAVLPPDVRLVQGYGLSETPCLHGSAGCSNTRRRSSCRVDALVPGSTCGSWTSWEQRFSAGQTGELVVLGAGMSCVSIGIIRRKLLLCVPGRLLSYGDVGLSGCGRFISTSSGPLEGHDRHGRRERLLRRGRGGALRASRSSRCRGLRNTGPPVG